MRIVGRERFTSYAERLEAVIDEDRKYISFVDLNTGEGFIMRYDVGLLDEFAHLVSQVTKRAINESRKNHD